MWEMVENAQMGWQNYTDGGKLAALMAVALLYMWLCSKQKGPQGRLVLYCAVTAVLCVCPLTAAILMFYQTRFYDYQWIWSMVPLTAVIALGGVTFLTDQWKSGKGWKATLYNCVVTVASVAILLLCGGLGEESVDAVEAREGREHSTAVLNEVRELYGEDLCLWAPTDILEDARLTGEMRLLYGRNMWDAALNAYSYDTYSEEQVELYEWMEHLDDWAIDISATEVEEYVQRAFASGADCVLLPVEFTDWMQESEEDLLGRFDARKDMEVSRMDGYYLLKLR